MEEMKEKIGIEVAVALISEHYGLDIEAVTNILQAFGSLTPEQSERAAVVCAAFAAKREFDKIMAS